MAEEQKKNTAVAPTRAQFAPLNKVANLAELFKHPDFASRISMAAPKHFNSERLLRTMVQATQKTPKLMQVNPMSMLGACITLAALGLEPNTPLQHAHLIPFEVNKYNKETKVYDYVRTDVQVIIGYPGFIDLIFRGDKVKSLHCDVFYADEEASGAFSYSHGSKKHLHHKPSGALRPADEEPAGAYMYAELSNGGEEFTVMRLADLHRIRAKSQGFKAAMSAHDGAIKYNKDPMKDKRYADAPWIGSKEEMYKKTALRSGQKWLPKSVELAAALTIDGKAEEGSINFSTIMEGSQVLDGTYDEVEVEQAAIPVDNAPKITVPVDTKEKVTVYTDAQYTADQKKEAKTKAKAAPKSDEPPPGRFEQDPYDDSLAVSAHSAESIEYPLFNAFGENDDGPFGAAKDPIPFAADFARVYAEATPDQRITLYEFNEETLSRACTNGEANKIFVDIMQKYPQKAEVKETASMAEVKAQANDASQSLGPTDRLAEDTLDIPRSKTQKGGWDVVAWTKLAQVRLATLEHNGIEAFFEVNAASIAALPMTAKTIFQNAVEMRRAQLLPTTQPEDDEIPFLNADDDEVAMPDEPEPAKETVIHPKDEWEKLYLSFEIQIRMTKTMDALREIANNVAMKVQLRRIKENRPDLADALTKQYAEKEAELKGKINGKG
jgi:recombination protein RecT